MKMQFLCLGDIAFPAGYPPPVGWAPALCAAADGEARVAFNFELPLGDAANPVPRSSGPRLIAYPQAEAGLRELAPGLAALANNHILDAGAAGLSRTIAALREAGLDTLGAGATGAALGAPVIWGTGAGRVGFLAWALPETHPDWDAVPGPCCWPGPAAAAQTVRQLKSTVDWVVVFVHWSDELFPYPRLADRVVARTLSEMGADLVIGHHPHVVRGMEVIGACPIFYSLGNFYFADIRDGRGGWITREAPRNREGLGVRVTLRRGERPEWEALSFWNAGSRVVVDPWRRAARRMVAGSRILSQLEGRAYAEWYAARRARFDRWEYWWYFRLWRIGKRDGARLLSRLTRER